MYRIAALFLCASPMLLTACKHDSAEERTEVAVRFAAQVGDQPFLCGATYEDVGVGSPGTYQVNDFRFYVHDVALISDHGHPHSLALTEDGQWQQGNLALLDFENGCASSGNAALNTQVRGTVDDEEHFTGICFTLGVPFGLNHIDNTTAAPPLDTDIGSGMLWSWTNGRKFVRIDGVGDPGNINQAFNVHLGSTGCSVGSAGPAPDAACKYPNTPRICLTNFNVATQVIIADVAAVLAGSNVTSNTSATPSGCTAANFDPECLAIIPALGIDFVYDDGVNAPVTFPRRQPQQFFRAGNI